MKIININGPINSGKSTISRLASQQLPDSIFIEVDDFEGGDLPFDERIAWRLDQLYQTLEHHLLEDKLKYVILAYPMYPETFQKISEIAQGRAQFIVITLAPDLETCLTNRGNRALDAWKIGRIKEMYDEGVPSFEPSDLFINNSTKSPAQTAQEIIEFLTKIL